MRPLSKKKWQVVPTAKKHHKRNSVWPYATTHKNIDEENKISLIMNTNENSDNVGISVRLSHKIVLDAMGITHINSSCICLRTLLNIHYRTS